MAGQDFDDKLEILSFSENSIISSFLLEQLQGNFTSAELSMTPQGSNYRLEVVNKYFSSSIQVEKDVLITGYSENPLNFFVCVDNLKEWSNLTQFKGVGALLKSEGAKIKAIVADSVLSEMVDTNEMYDKLDTFVPVFYLTPKGPAESNAEALGDIKDVISNNLWTPKPKPKPKEETKEETKSDSKPSEAEAKKSKKEKPLRSLEDEDMNFMKIFGQLMTFKDMSKELSPRSRKEQASNLILQLEKEMNELDGSEEDEVKKKKKKI